MIKLNKISNEDPYKLFKDKYEDADLDVIRSFDMKNGNQFNIVREYNTVLNDVELFALGTLETNKRKQYETLAKLNGYVDEKTKKVTDQSLAIFFDEYTKVLEKRQGD